MKYSSPYCSGIKRNIETMRVCNM